MYGNDISKQIEIHKSRLEMYKIEKEYLWKKMIKGPAGYKPIDYSGMPHGSSDDSTIDVKYDEICRVQHQIELEEWAIEALEKQVQNIKDKIKDLKGIDAQVKYLRDMEGMRLQEIADRLGYELGYIKNVSCRNPK